MSDNESPEAFPEGKTRLEQRIRKLMWDGHTREEAAQIIMMEEAEAKKL